VHYLKVGVWCAVKVHKITGPIFVKETVNTYQYVCLILTPLFGDLRVEEEMYGHLTFNVRTFKWQELPAIRSFLGI
jgi:hypothetical protein